MAADHANVEPADSHLPLVFMLVLSQLAVGAAVSAAFSGAFTPLVLIAVLAGALAPLVALLHLGKPLKAWRAFLGWRTSWFSREVIAFGAFVPLVSCALASSVMGWKSLGEFLTILSGFTGIAAVACSAMIYVDTRREFWRASQTFIKFFGTTLLLGATATLTQKPVLIAAALPGVVTIAKLALEFSIFRAPLRPSAYLLAGELRAVWRLRVICAVLGGLILPAIGIVTIAFLCCVAGELLERYLFFTAVAPQKMPGGLAA